MTHPRPRLASVALFLTFALLGSPSARAATPERGPGVVFTSTSGQRFTVETIATGLQQPWGIAPTPDGRILVTERPGRLRVVRAGLLDPTPLSGVPLVSATNQGGLLDITLHPDYASNRLVYMSFVVRNAIGEALRVASFVDNSSTPGGGLTDRRVVFKNTPLLGNTSGLHFAGRIAFGRRSPEGPYLMFISCGDRHIDERAQNPALFDGKILRLFDDGRIPPGNPFVGNPSYRPQIYSLGHRNPQGLAFQPATDGGPGRLFETEHGNIGTDEINWIRPGRNFGWPTIRGDETAPGLITPLRQFTPSVAPSGCTFYNATLFPTWRGNLFVGCLAGTCILRVEVSGGRVTGVERLLENEFGRIRDVAEGPDGSLYFVTGNSDADPVDILGKIVPAP